MTLHIASPVAHPERIRAGSPICARRFAVVAPYLVSVPLYGGMWMMACASPTLNPAYLTPLDVDRRIAQRRHSRSAVLQRRHASRRLRAAQFRARPRRLRQRYGVGGHRGACQARRPPEAP